MLLDPNLIEASGAVACETQTTVKGSWPADWSLYHLRRFINSWAGWSGFAPEGSPDRLHYRSSILSIRFIRFGKATSYLLSFVNCINSL